MYVTMMMTDQIPLDLAPPPLLNGDVPLMPHMVNGDAVQQVSIHARALADANVTGPGACQAAPAGAPHCCDVIARLTVS